MDANRFDDIAVSLADSGASRRSLLGRVAAGALAAALSALGIGGFGPEDAEAKSCKKRCKKKELE